MARTSAGLLLFRKSGPGLEVFLVHPGGPFWRGKDAGAWSIPKGEIGAGEDPLAAARRELAEETGVSVDGDFELGDTVSIATRDGHEFARGLAAYGGADLRKIRGLQSAGIEATLGYKGIDEAIHRDDLVIL